MFGSAAVLQKRIRQTRSVANQHNTGQEQSQHDEFCNIKYRQYNNQYYDLWVLHADAELIEEVYDIDGLLQEIDISGKSSFGTGGIHTKIEAARHLGVYGIPTLLLNGETKDVILKARSGEVSGTGFFFNEQH